MAVYSDRLLWRTYYVLLLFVSVDIASSVRLYGHKTKYEGGIEIYYDSLQTWNPLCGDCWTNYSANVACKELGFSGGIRANIPFSRPGVITAYFDCPTGNEANLSSCAFYTYPQCNPCITAAGVLCAVDGGWSQWSYYGGCSATCGEGVQKWIRSCNNPTPLNGGFICAGSNISRGICNERICPIYGGWSPWMSYGPCSVTCGEGVQTEKRLCNNPTPQYGGSACAGRNKIVGFCNERPCPKTWNESCLMNSDCTDHLTCNDRYNTCDCMRVTDVWDPVHMICLSSLEFLAIYSPERLDFASATKYCTNNMTGFLATRDFMNNMFLTCMDTNHDIWLANTIETTSTNDGETNEVGMCTTGGVIQASEMLLTSVNCSENRNFVCVVNRTHMPLVTNETFCSGFISVQLNTDSGDIPLGTMVVAVVTCAMVLLVAAVIICILRNKLSKGGTTSGSINTELEVRYNNTATPVADQEDPDHLSHEEAGPAIETDHYGYGILGKTSGAERNPVGIDDDDFYSHTNTNQPFGSEYDVFERKKEDRDESGIYDHTKPGGMEEGQYDEFQDPKSSCVNNDDFIYNTDTDEFP
ncbi:uncharacterized protein LOC110459366 isoform X2 [Mizuhopecten yessoensis]|uniref:uncharacterized protein LOC110459366 isoform X2 n=1 Tax=Mizuhopecten yessoensis TaxID=6573 RepID=UPI000B45BC06|nr:uncharacterized protein LOC110459366 isoform X2 [Mizuhopecten yessoensis]